MWLYACVHNNIKLISFHAGLKRMSNMYEAQQGNVKTKVQLSTSYNTHSGTWLERRTDMQFTQWEPMHNPTFFLYIYLHKVKKNCGYTDLKYNFWILSCFACQFRLPNRK